MPLSVATGERIALAASFAFFVALATFMVIAPEAFYIGVPGRSEFRAV